MIEFFLDYLSVVFNYNPVKFAYGIMLACAVLMLAFKLFKGESHYD